MKRCPKCLKEYAKDTETVCWLDGTALVFIPPPVPLPPTPQQKAKHPPLPPTPQQKVQHPPLPPTPAPKHPPLPLPPTPQQKAKHPPLPPIPSQKAKHPPLPPVPKMPPFDPNAPTVLGKCPPAPKYEPNVWNDAKPNKLGGVQLTTNCYSYAVNDKGEGHPIDDGSGDPYKPQPGELCGHPFYNEVHPDDPKLDVLADCQVVKKAVECDSKSQPNKLGMQLIQPHPPKDQLPPEKPGYYLVALVVDPGVDYHWYRQDDNGKWSHKPGSYPVTNLDASGKEIVNPRACDRNGSKNGAPNYSLFCGYYYVPKCGMLVGTNTQDAKDKHKVKGIN